MQLFFTTRQALYSARKGNGLNVIISPTFSNAHTTPSAHAAQCPALSVKLRASTFWLGQSPGKVLPLFVYHVTIDLEHERRDPITIRHKYR